MALSPDILTEVAWAKLLAKGFVMHTVQGVPTAKDFVRAISEAVVEHIQIYGNVNVTVTVDPVTHVGAGTGKVF